MRLQPIDRTDLARAWAVAEPWLAGACARPGCDLTVAALRRACDREEAALILILDGDRPVAAGVTQVRDRAGGDRSCWVLSLGGAACGSWSAVIAAIEAGAALIGCATVEFIGRRAWSRLFPDYRADPHAVGFHFSKRLGLEP